MSNINGERHPKGDRHGKPIPRDDTPVGGCPMAPASAAALVQIIVAVAAVRASRSLSAPTRRRAGSFHPRGTP